MAKTNISNDALLYGLVASMVIVVLGVVFFNLFIGKVIKDDHDEEPKGSKWFSASKVLEEEEKAAAAAGGASEGDKKDD